MEGVLDSYLSHCRPPVFAPSWECLPAHPNAFRGPVCPTSAWQALTARHSAKELLASGVAEAATGDGTLSIKQMLAVPAVPLIALRGHPNGKTINLLTNNGLPSRRTTGANNNLLVPSADPNSDSVF
jgi:hypothetical protein